MTLIVDKLSYTRKEMSTRGDVPIPCHNQRQCKMAGSGMTWCNPVTGHCQNPQDDQQHDAITDPLGMTSRRFMTTASQGTLGNMADMPKGNQDLPLDDDPLTWKQTAESMAFDAMRLSTVQVPSQPEPTIWQRLNYIFLGTMKRAYIVSAIVVLIALISRIGMGQ